MAGSHVVHALQETRRYKVVSIDNYYNSYPRAFSRLEELARSGLPPDASETEKEATAIDAYRCDLTNPADVRAIFEKYGKGGIWGVVHVAVRFHATFCPSRGGRPLSSGAKQAYKAVGESKRDPGDVLPQQCHRDDIPPSNYVQNLQLHPTRLLVLRDRLWRAYRGANPRNNATKVV